MLCVCLRIFEYREEMIEVVYKYCVAALQMTQDLVCCVLVMKQSFEYGTPNEVYNDRRIEIDF